MYLGNDVWIFGVFYLGQQHPLNGQLGPGSPRKEENNRVDKRKEEKRECDGK